MRKDVLTIVGEGLFGADWIPIMENQKFSFRKEFKTSLSRKYNEEQRLPSKKKYKVHILAGNEIEKKQERTTENLKRLAEEKYGFKSFETLKGEGVFLCRLKISNQKMREMGFDYISMLHKPYEDDYGDEGFIIFDDSLQDNIYLYYAEMNDYWAKNGGFIFLEEIPVPQSKKDKKPL